MSVRRLAEDTMQPDGFQFTSENLDWAEATINKYPAGRQQSAVIPLLMRAQDQDGWVTKPAIEHVADMLGMPYIRVLEVATFYTQFQLKPVGSRAHVQVCGTTPCMLRGSEALMDVCRRKIHHDQFETNEEGTLSWEEVECQGACVNAPMVMILKDTYEDLTPERLEEIIDLFEAGNGEEVTPGPQIDRIYSAPEGGLTSLRSEDKKPSGKTTPKRGPTKEDGESAPSKAGRPETSAPETDAAIEGPSAKKHASSEEDHNTGDRTGPKAGKTAKPADSVSDNAKGSSATGSAVKTDETRIRPAGIEKPKASDDLKMISGIGPKIEEKLNGIGIWTWRQIADWNEAEKAWVDGELSFSGRIDREDWIAQAAALADSGKSSS